MDGRDQGTSTSVVRVAVEDRPIKIVRNAGVVVSGLLDLISGKSALLEHKKPRQRGSTGVQAVENGAEFNSMDLRMTAERHAIDRIHEYIFQLFSLLALESDSNPPRQTTVIPLGENKQDRLIT